MQPAETFITDEHAVACDGGGGALGHPIEFLALKNGMAVCGYCGRRFLHRSRAEAEGVEAPTYRDPIIYA
jgi:uncharacterized Zn-finger protein